MREPYRIDEATGRRAPVSATRPQPPAPRRAERPEAIRADIERTRREMGGTVDAIQERLSPDRLAEQAKEAISAVADHAVRTAKEAISDVSEHAKETVREATIGRAEQAVSRAGETARSFGASMTETVRQNPVPALLAGIGIGWLLMKSREVDGHAAYRRTERYRTSPEFRYGYGYDTSTGAMGRMAGHTRESVAETAADVRERISDVTARAQETLSDATARAQEQAQVRGQQVRGQFERLMQENPLAMGACALACGAALGLLLPSTRKEDELLGGARDTLVESARETAQETMQKVQRVAEEAQHAAQEGAKDQGRAA